MRRLQNMGIMSHGRDSTANALNSVYYLFELERLVNSRCNVL